MANESQIWRIVGFDLSPADACKKSLLSVIEQQIVPQLIRAHAEQLTDNSTQVSQRFVPTSADIEEFGRLAHHEDERLGWEMLDRLVQERHSIPEILLKLIAPAARYLGEMWEQDRLSFTEVTLGLLRMQNMTHHYGFVNRRLFHQAGPKSRVMVAAAPGSQHLLGLAMVSEFFVNDGWDVHVEVANTKETLLSAIHSDWFDVMGLSVALVEQIDSLPELVMSLRSHSLNPNMGVLLGGAAFTQDVAAVKSWGADAVCLDPVEAMRIARRFSKRSLGSDRNQV